MSSPSVDPTPSPWKLSLLGILLFLFIPVVLFLFVRHPEPIWLSLIAGVVLMVGHRRLARPYMLRVLPVKCVWCNRIPPKGGDGAEILELRTGGGELRVRCCPGHREPAARYFTCLHRWRMVLRAGIFLPLLLLLGTLAAVAFGREAPLPTVTALFQGVVGLTVNLAAFGYLAVRPRLPVEVPFPAHNFFLLGLRNLLWVFRIVGIWWIVISLRFFLS
ncbi:MAG TPA: hypothetical protein VHN15_10865 [Thermoanaerobaculia bacterium]|nr:hypothetical protein [Thermoanaerobaculia bacterium]